jgi:4-alpha-glucanotransferase
VPLSGPDGTPLTLEQLYSDERSFRLAGIMNGFTGPILVPGPETELIV